MKETLSSLNPSIPEILPDGSIKKMAEEFGKHPASITRMLTGETGSDENVKAVFDAAYKIIIDFEETKKDTIKAIKKMAKSI